MAGTELEILKGITLEIKSGESVAIIGASGSGKSTLLGLLAGLDEASGGSVTINGTDLGTLDEDGRARFRGEHIGFVFQSFQLLPALTALENVMLPLELQGQSEVMQKAEHYLKRVELDARMGHYPLQLSGGEQQRVALARAFASRPAILFADEPTGNLDSRTGDRIIDLVFELNREEGTTLVLVTHDSALADRCDRRLRLDGGALVKE
jgi:putative ABC transport system ATP-binding protein|tara:strand:+ start:688 stop:1314 length:627 start_codon:yes stop_codon:yes gene_type:complete